MLPASNYESHQTYTGPGSRREVHEYRSYSSSAGGNIGGGGDHDFSLERQVQHMLPPGSLLEQQHGHGGGGYISGRTSPGSGLSSANMVSNVQQQNQSYSSYKVQTNQVSSTIDTKDVSTVQIL